MNSRPAPPWSVLVSLILLNCTLFGGLSCAFLRVCQKGDVRGWLTQVRPIKKCFRIHERLVIGRSLPGLGDKTISRRHFAITDTESDGFVLRDLGSKNGTFLNNKKVVKKHLRPWDIIRTGESRFIFKPVSTRM